MSDNPCLNFKSQSEEINRLFTWWAKLKDEKGLRAELRCCNTIADVVFVPGFHALRQELQMFGKLDCEKLACVAGLLSHVKTQRDGATFAEQMAEAKKGSESTKVSGLRFRRLLQCKTHEDLFTAMRRIIKLLDSNVNTFSLAYSVYNWNEWEGKVKKQWAYDYYTKAPKEK